MKTSTLILRAALNGISVPFNAFHALHAPSFDDPVVWVSIVVASCCTLTCMSDLSVLVARKRRASEDGVPEHALESRLEAENVHEEEEI